MKLCLVTETFPPEINGVAMTLSRLVDGLHRRGHSVTVIRPSFRDRGHWLPPGDHRQVVLPGFPIPGYPLMRLGWPAGGKLARLWRQERPDVVHIATEGPLGWSALRTARKLGLPVTSTFHTNFHHYSAHYGLGPLLKPVLAYLRAFHNRTRVTLAPTATLNRDLAAAGFQRLEVLGRGVDIDLFHPGKRSLEWRRRRGIADDALLVVHVSRLAKEKNYGLLAESFRAIKAIQPGARLLLVSDGPERKALERLLPGAVFTGFLSPGELATAYASGDLFLYPSLTETFGNVLTEALSSGLPTVAFDYAAAGQYVRDGENGRLVPFGARENFIATSVALAQDGPQRQRLGHHARASAEKIPWSQVIQRFEEILLRHAQAGPAASP